MKNGKTQGRPVWGVTTGSYYMTVQRERVVRPPDSTWTVIPADTQAMS